MSSSRVDSVSFVQINPEKYQSRPPLPEDVPLAHTDSSVNLTSFALYSDLNLPLDLYLIAVESYFVGPSASRTASDIQVRVDDPFVESVGTRKRSAISAGSSDR